MADDALSRARKALASPKGGAVVPAGGSGRDLIAQARAAAQRPVPTAPVVRAAPSDETKGAASTALVVRIREAAARPVPVRPVVKAPEPPPNEPAPAKAGVEAPAPVPVAAPTAPVPAKQVVPVEIAPGQTVPVEIMPQNGQAGAQQPINIVVNVQNNEPRGWGPYWPYPYYGHCRAWNCPRARGLPCTGWFCLW